MELSKYISENILNQLDKKGWDKEAVIEKIETFARERESLGFTGDALTLSTKNRIKGFFNPILRRNTISMKAIIFSLSKPIDDNERMRRMSKLKEGESGYGPDKEYEVKEGFYPWGSQQGQEISMDSNWSMDGFVGIQHEDKLNYKSIRFSGMWLNDKLINKANGGDVVMIDLDPAKLDNNVVYVSGYKYVEQLEEARYLKLIQENLKGYHKSINNIVETNYKGFAIIKGAVSDIESGNYGFNFDIIDDADNWDIENSLTGSMKEVNFIDGAEGLLFIGDVYKKGKGQAGYALNIQKVIVPEQYKKKDLPKENIEAIEKSFDNDLKTIDEGLL